MSNFKEEYEPFPQALKGKKGLGWKISDTGDLQGACSPSTKELFVPTQGPCTKCGEDHAFAVRRHEMGHARWTPPRAHLKVQKINDEEPGAIDDMAVQSVEDMRLGVLLHQAGIEDHSVLCTEEEADFKTAFGTWPHDKRITYGVAARTYPKDFAKFYEANNKVDYSKFPGETAYELRNQIESVYNELHRRPTGPYRSVWVETPTFDDTIRAARHLTTLMKTVKESKESAYKKEMKRKAKEAALEKARKKAEEAKTKAEAHKPIPEIKKLFDGSKTNRGTSTGSRRHSIWAPMNIIEEPMPEALPGRLLSRYTASDEGAYVRSIHRFPIDGKIFGRKTTKPGGTILLDASGSMAWDHEDMWNVLKSCPGATIALYEGNHREGELRILARDGKHCTKERASYRKWGGNDVDGPALEWLCEQQGPRIFICDGGVIAPFGTAQAAKQQCGMLIDYGNIAWLNPSGYRERLGPATSITVNGFGEPLTEAIVKQLKTGGAIFVP